MSPSAARDVPEFLAAYEAQVRPMRERSAGLRWHLALTGDDRAVSDLESLEKELAEVHADPEAARRVASWLEDGAAPDPGCRRQLERVRLAFLERQAPRELRDRIIDLELRIEQVFGTFRAELDGVPAADNELDRILKDERDPDRRRRAWEATRDVGREVAPRVREVARLRNALARGLGFPDYRAFALHLQEFDVPALDALLDRFERETRPAYAKVKAALDRDLSLRYGVAPDALRPWHYPQRFHQSVPRTDPDLDNDAWFPVPRIEELTLSTFSGLGLPIDEVWERSDLLPRAGKNQHAFCIGIDSPRDVRVLCNLAASERWMTTTLHEFGHAAYERGLPDALPWVLREPAHTLATEAVAMWFGRLTGDPRWLRDAGLPADRADRAAGLLAEDQVVFARWGLTVSMFERELYRDPDQDLDAAWWRLVSALQGLSAPEGRRAPDWAAKVHVACYPAYYQNYLLGEMLASQMDAALEARTGRAGGGGAVLGHPEAGAFFHGLFALGATLRWDEAVARATGGPLDPRHHAARFLAPAGG